MCSSAPEARRLLDSRHGGRLPPRRQTPASALDLKQQPALPPLSTTAVPTPRLGFELPIHSRPAANAPRYCSPWRLVLPAPRAQATWNLEHRLNGPTFFARLVDRPPGTSRSTSSNHRLASPTTLAHTHIMSERPMHRGGGRGGGGGGFRGGRGGGRGGAHGPGGDKAGGDKAAERPKKENILDLAKYMDKQITVKFNGGREVTGTLKGYDALMNLVLDDVKETLRDDQGNESSRSLGLVVARGTLLVVITPVDGSEVIANPFAQPDES
ncbi:hypothetical protein Purlil1_3578 [Purpureocillium lilacinum]|uniref:Sm domain-containing protein n=2 Tax=Purpureocillium lilacinum TaxID=33203 RepID=A0ABR0C7W1_PURLI|nr:hypothetical protein Purlil1_3578 [Purpureocillium lilacinum]